MTVVGRGGRVRVLFTCAGEIGHFHPLIPVARSLTGRGHDVAFAVPATFRSRAEAAGFVTLPAGLDRPAIAAEIDRRFPDWRAVPLEDRLRFALADVGARVVAPVMTVDLVAAVEAWDAELLVHGPAVFAGPLAAEVTGIPHANHGWGPLPGLDDLALAADAMAPLWAGRGFDRPPLAGMFRYLYLDICPPSLQTPDSAAVEVAHPLRPTSADGTAGQVLPPWIAALPPVPTVYVTLGTFCNRFTHLFTTILAGLAEVPVNVIVTVGDDQDPVALGPQPDHVHVVRYLPTSLVLRHCRLVVSHGGSGTMLAALARGVPLLLVPQGHDHSRNAELCAGAGVGRSLCPGELTPGAVQREVAAMLDRSQYAEAARAVRDEIDAMPGPDEAAGLLERLAVERRPLLRPLRPGG